MRAGTERDSAPSTRTVSRVVGPTVRPAGGRGLAPQQPGHQLGDLVGVAQHRAAGLQLGLELGEVGDLGGEVGVADDGLGGGRVLQGGPQVVGGALQGVRLERPEVAPQGGDLVDRPGPPPPMASPGAPLVVDTSMSRRLANWLVRPVPWPRASVVTLSMDTVAVCPAFAPIWKVRVLSATAMLAVSVATKSVTAESAESATAVKLSPCSPRCSPSDVAFATTLFGAPLGPVMSTCRFRPCLATMPVGATSVFTAVVPAPVATRRWPLATSRLDGEVGRRPSSWPSSDEVAVRSSPSAATTAGLVRLPR